jgi:hypothetical protein
MRDAEEAQRKIQREAEKVQWNAASVAKHALETWGVDLEWAAKQGVVVRHCNNLIGNAHTTFADPRYGTIDLPADIIKSFRL